jgi:hypothetical protein
MKSAGTLALEAFVVGALLVLVFRLVSLLGRGLVMTVFLSGALFHLACEATGVNAWYARNYFSRSSMTP